LLLSRHLGERGPSRLVATAAEKRLNIRRNSLRIVCDRHQLPRAIIMEHHGGLFDIDEPEHGSLIAARGRGAIFV
jgi:hypothetical protein